MTIFRCQSYRYLFSSLLFVLFFTVAFSVAQAQKPMSDREKAILGTIRFDQNLNQQIPLDLEFVDETGQTVQLKEFFGEKPVILVMAYYECSMLCTLVLNGLLNSLKEVDFDVGNQFNVVTVSIDPDETPEMATEKKESYLTFYGRPGAEHGWHFLTGEEETIRSLTDEIGFHYVYDDRIDEYAHPSGIIIATPEGRISRYFYGIEYPPNDVRLGLIEASAGKIGSTIDQILLMCYHYDPDTGRYNLVIRNVMKIAGTLTFFCVAIPIIVLLIRERRSKKMENSNNPILRI